MCLSEPSSEQKLTQPLYGTTVNTKSCCKLEGMLATCSCFQIQNKKKVNKAVLCLSTFSAFGRSSFSKQELYLRVLFLLLKFSATLAEFRNILRSPGIHSMIEVFLQNFDTIQVSGLFIFLSYRYFMVDLELCFGLLPYCSIHPLFTFRFFPDSGASASTIY